MAELRIYPSGFRGSAVVKTTTPIDLERNRERMFSSSAIVETEARPAALAVCQLWGALSAGAKEASSFEFHERVLAVALAVFGTVFVYDWCVDQRKSPNWDEYHQRWIDETLAFVVRGKPREFSPFNWTALLGAPGQCAPNTDSRMVREIFFDRERIGTAFTLEQFITLWLQQPGGIDDLTNSLYVLFGGR